MKKFILIITCFVMTILMVQAQNLNSTTPIIGDEDWIPTNPVVKSLQEQINPKDGFVYWQTPNYFGYYNSGLGAGRGIGFLANNDFTISQVGIQGDLVGETFDVLIYASSDGHSAGSNLYTETAFTGGTGYGWNDITFTTPFQFVAGSYYVLNWRPTDGEFNGGLEFYNDNGLPFTIADATLIDGCEGTNPDFTNTVHCYFRIYTEDNLVAPTNLSANLDDPTGEVTLNWDYQSGGINEDFNDGVADNWIPREGTWTVPSNFYESQSGPLIISSSYYDEDFSNYELVVDMRKSSGLNSWGSGLFFNGDPSGIDGYGYWENSYNLLFDHNTGNWFMVKWEFGSYTYLQSNIYSPDLNLGISAWNEIKVVFANGNIDIHFNGILQGTYYDNTYLTGKIGLASYDDAISGIGEFDNISLTPLAKGYTFGKVSQENYRDVYAKNTNPVNNNTSIGRELAPEIPYEGQYTYEGGNPKAFQHFIVYRDGTEIGTTTNTTYSDFLPTYDTYIYTVTAFYDEGESDPAGPVQVDWIGDPDIMVDPLSLSETLTPDDLSIQDLFITNNGYEDLLVDLNIIYAKDRNEEPLLIPGKPNSNITAIDNESQSNTLKPNKYNNSNNNPKSNSVLYINTLNGGDADFRAQIAALPNVGVFDELDGGSNTPNLAYLQGYDLVILASNSSFADRITLGNNLAAYADLGGGVCLLNATICGTSGFTLGGLITDPAYSPLAFTSYGGATVTCSSFTPHDITTGVSLIETDLYAYTYPQGSGVSLGTYNTGDHMGAYNPNKPIVAINVFPYDGYWGGDFILMMSNTIDWLTGNTGSGWLAVNPTSIAITPGTTELIDVTFNSTGLTPGTYNADIEILSNDPDEPFIFVPAELTVTNALTPPTNLTADIDQATGQVDLNWDLVPTSGFNEDFEDGVADNFVFSDGRFTVSGGDLVMTGNSDGTWASTYYDESFDDFTMEFEVTRLQSSSTLSNTMGAFFRSDGFLSYGSPCNGFLIVMSAGGTYSVWKEQAGVESNIIPWQTSPFINTGLGASNIVTIVANGPNIDFYFNGNFVNGFSDGTFTSGFCNLVTYDSSSGPNLITWDYVTVAPTTKFANNENNIPVQGQISKGDATNCNEEIINNPPVKVQGILGDNFINNSKSFLYFIIYRDGSVIGTSTATTYTDYLTAFGTYDYAVTAFYDEGESNPAGPVQVIYEGVPDISVLPTSLTETLLTDQTSIQYLTIFNDGDVDLIADLDIVFAKDNNEEPLLIPGKTIENHLITEDITLESPLQSSGNLLANPDAKSNSVLYINALYGYDNNFKAALSALPNIGTFDEINASTSTPNVAYLMAYDVVIVVSGFGFADPTTTGNNLATYVDQGGSVCIVSASFIAGGSWTLLGTIMNPDYCPLATTDYEITNVICNTFVPHPITDGLTTIETGLYAYTYPQGSGVSLGTYNTGDHMAAYNPDKPIVAINVFPQDDYWGGDMIQMMSNTIDWLTANNPQWLSLDPISVTIPAGTSYDIDAIFNSTGLATGVYTADIEITSNDPDEPMVIVPATLNVVDPLSSDLKAFLEGPFFSTDMNSLLNVYGYIPFNQPYNVAPWNYNGGETVGAIPNPDVVDWILVELRETSGDATTATAGTMVGQRAGFILKDGSIVDLDGISPLVFNHIATENIYAVIYHRNHLGVMSATPLLGGGTSFNYDFTTGADKVFMGDYTYKEVAPGIWALLSGNSFNDRDIDNKDKDDVFVPEIGTVGYLFGDMNLDGQVDDIDKQIFWESNAGSSSQIPE